MSLRLFLFALSVLFWHGALAGENRMTIASDATPPNTVNHHQVTVINRGLTLPNSTTIKAVALYSAIPRSVKIKIVERTGAGAYTVHRDMPWPHPGGGWQWLNIPAYAVPASGTFHLGYYYPSTSNNIIGVNPSIARATTSPDVGTGSFTGITESSSDVAAMGYSTETMQTGFGMVAAGIIRPNGSGGWYILNDGDHAPINLASLTVYSTHIEVNFSQAFGQLNTFTVVGDDDIALARIMVGASCGLTKIGIVMSDNSGTVNPTTITNTLANINIFVAGSAAP